MMMFVKLVVKMVVPVSDIPTILITAANFAIHGFVSANAIDIEKIFDSQKSY